MHSRRCVMIVQHELKNLGHESHCIELGTVLISGKLKLQKMEILKYQLAMAGLEVMDDKKTSIANQIKSFIQFIISSEDDFSEINITTFLKEKMNMDYRTLAKAFSERNKPTLKQYIISERVKKVKDLIENHRDKLAEISNKLHYSSTAHLCHEFKKVTGFTPKIFRKNA